MSNHFDHLEWSGSKLCLSNTHGERQQLESAGRLLEQAEFLEAKTPSEQQCSNTNYLIDDIIECQVSEHANKKLVLINRNTTGDMLNDNQENDIIVVAANASDQNSKEVIEDIILIETDADDNAEADLSELYSNHVTTDNYADSTPQFVTEEVVTDDWVEHTGAERVEIPAEQIISTISQEELDVEVPLPAIQDSYSICRPYPCDFCNLRFRKKVCLVHHMASHQNNRFHLCKICNSRFSRPQELINHLKIHSEEVKDIKLEDEDYSHLKSLSNEYNSCDVNYNVSKESLPMQTRSNHDSQERNTDQMNGNNMLLEEVSPTSKDNNTDNNVTATIPATTKGRISRLKLKKNIPPLDYDLLDSYTTSPSKSITNLKVKANDRKSFICYLCGLSFASEKAILTHAKTHNKDLLQKCIKSGELFANKESFERHEKVHEFDGSTSEYDPNETDATDVSTSDSNTDSKMYGEYYCSECGLSFHRRDLLKRHRKIHNKNSCRNGGDIHSCNICGETFAEALDLLAHTKTHGPCLKCVLCGDTFFEEIAIGQHLESKHSNELSDYTCMLCGKDFRDRRALSKHLWDHSNEKNYNCSKCDKKFQNKTRLKRHMSSHRNKSVECNVCHELFPDGRTLSNHRHSHNSSASAKLFPCHQCGKSFGSRSSQQIHVRIHTGEKPYGCGYCWKAFADGGTLRKHERIHTGEKPYACPVCSRAFNQRVVLREHIRTHHSAIDPIKSAYYCSVCHAEMNSSNDLIQHLIEHSDVNTAMKREPTNGPRKYKRRRKLKPHEIARLKRLNKLSELGNQSDSDASEDGLSPLPNHSNRIKESTSSNTANYHLRSKRIANIDRISANDERTEELHSADDNKKKLENISYSPKKTLVKLSKSKKSGLLNNSIKCKEQKEIQNSLTNSGQYADDELNAIQDYDGSCARVRHQLPTRSKTNRKVKTETTPVNSNATNLIKTNIDSPPISHTETPDVLSNRKMTSNLIKTPLYNTNSLTNPSTIVDDYDIISPALHPPKQISISPLSIKHEAASEPQIHQIHQPLTSDIFDNQLLLECSSIRNDLEDILHSPMKLEKYSRRSRFISGSSTQFEVSDEEHFIKHEPASPDLREIINRNTNFNNLIELNDTPNAQSSQPWLSSTANITPTKCLNMNSQLKSHSETSSPNYTANTSIKRIKLRKSEGNHTAIHSVDDSEAFLDYIMESTFNTNTPAHASNSFSSISAVVSAADATAAAQQHLSLPPRKHHHYFECEMCSAVFTDRAQLLEHVPIHI